MESDIRINTVVLSQRSGRVNYHKKLKQKRCNDIFYKKYC